MNHPAKSIRPFIGAKNYTESIRFYTTLGFTVHSLGPQMSVVHVNEQLSFYLQNAFVKEWVDNTMLFLEVEDIKHHWEAMKVLGLPDKFPGVRLSTIQIKEWGIEFFLHDPSGILCTLVFLSLSFF
jgi:catechol 2,3-dioxygenase-like lactoylglutathione lyase family enzyme